jgi:hypothetical protein
VWPARRPVVGVEAGRRPVGRPAIAQPAGPPVLFRRQFGTRPLGATGRASAPRGLRQGKANVRKDTERSVAAERSRHSRRSLPTLLHCRRRGHAGPATALSLGSTEGEADRRPPDGGAWLVVSDRPGTLLCPALLRTGLAPFNASGSSKSRRSAGLSPYDPIPGWGSEASAGPLTTTTGRV